MSLPRFTNATDDALSLFSAIEVSGEDAKDFLHRITTADMQTPPAFAALCTPQGLVRFYFSIQKTDAGYQLITTKDTAEAFVKALRMYVLRSKVTVRAVDAPVFALEKPVTGQAPEVLLTTEPTDGVRLTQDAFLVTQVATARPWIFAANAMKYHPASLGMDDGVTLSFKKGCYPGQEIVTRMHHAQTRPARLARLMMKTTTLPAPGSDVLADDVLVGRVLYSAQNAAGVFVLACVSGDLSTSALRVGAEAATLLSVV